MKTFILTILFVGAFAAPRVKVQPSGESRVVGGTEVPEGGAPYQLSVRSAVGPDSHFCGASILDPDTYLCAGHCGDDPNIYVIAGDNDFFVDSGNEQTVDVASVVRHVDFDPFTLLNDIALYFGQTSFVFNTYVNSVGLPAMTYLGVDVAVTGDPCCVFGWGTTSSGGTGSPRNLLATDLDVLADSDCNDQYVAVIAQSMLCAGKAGGGYDACQGDSGGPLTAGYYGDTDPMDRTQIGIVSWGNGCADPDYAGVYTQTSYFLDWIQDNSNLIIP